MLVKKSLNHLLNVWQPTKCLFLFQNIALLQDERNKQEDSLNPLHTEFKNSPSIPNFSYSSPIFPKAPTSFLPAASASNTPTPKISPPSNTHSVFPSLPSHKDAGGSTSPPKMKNKFNNSYKSPQYAPSSFVNYHHQQGSKPEWKRYKQYSKDELNAAIEAVKSGMSTLVVRYLIK